MFSNRVASGIGFAAAVHDATMRRGDVLLSASLPELEISKFRPFNVRSPADQLAVEKERKKERRRTLEGSHVGKRGATKAV